MSALAENIFIGLLAAFSLSILTWIAALVRDHLVRRRYPVGGTYASSYEDQIDGRVAFSKAITVFKQRGRRLWAEVSNLADERQWQMEAQIGRGGRIYGTYSSADPYDEGLGGFFLEQGTNGRLEGVWAGYDSVNKSVAAGRYLFWPLREAVIRPMTHGDLADSLSLLGEALGHRYISREDLSEYVHAEISHCAYVAEVQDAIIAGAATGIICTPDEFVLALPAGTAAAVMKQVRGLEYHRIGILKSIAVSPSAGGCGIGTRLAQAVVQGLWQRGATYIITIGWTDSDGCHIEGVVDGLGFQKVAQMPNFWTQDSFEKDYECPSCGQPCQCEALIFALRKADLRESPMAQITH